MNSENLSHFFFLVQIYQNNKMPCGQYYHESYPSELEHDFVRGIQRTGQGVRRLGTDLKEEVEGHKFWAMAALAVVLVLACMHLTGKKK